MVLIFKGGFGQKEDKAIEKVVTPASFFQYPYLTFFGNMKHQWKADKYTGLYTTPSSNSIAPAVSPNKMPGFNSLR